jgi:hypothetical protein
MLYKWQSFVASSLLRNKTNLANGKEFKQNIFCEEFGEVLVDLKGISRPVKRCYDFEGRELLVNIVKELCAYVFLIDSTTCINVADT